MFRGVSSLSHAAVAIAILGTGLLAFLGVIAAPPEPEAYDQIQSVIAPQGTNGLRITETIDQDFGTQDRHGTRRVIPNDYGVVADIEVSSPDAPDELHVDSSYSNRADTEIRVGDADTTITGRHRYVLDYTLPAAQLDDGFLAIDAIGGLDFDTAHFQVVVAGFELANPRCFTGAFGSIDPCQIDRAADGTYVANIDDLPSGHGITIDGEIVRTVPVQNVEALPLPSRRSARPDLALGLIFTLIAAVSSIPVYFVARRKGRNQVVGAGAADAAFGELPGPTPTGSKSADPVGATRMVSDRELGEMATIEFEPPRGLQPWEGAVLLDERIDASTTRAYMSSLVGADALDIDKIGSNIRISPGANAGKLPAADRVYVDYIFAIANPYTTGSYDRRFAAIWNSINPDLARRIAARGWWRSGGPTSTGSGSLSLRSILFAIVPFLIFGFAMAGAAVQQAAGNWAISILFAVFVPMLVAFFAYRRLLPSRSATGSALALRTESFRRFLEASEARHVEWAWKYGVLREYSAWAVALGEATAWGRALDAADVPEPERWSAPLFVYTARSSFQSTTTAPSSSGSSSGGGGFSGGSVGGGGGGGGGGSW